MSRRAPNPVAERAAQNQQTIKTLLKLEGNKTCADCKRNKHPRWASWNLGIFVCIRCSGIHRGMGTHISRVKSVDLDAWTDEQLQSVLRWGNSRANKYWEAKLAPGHVPSEAKIENFIRTKYESKRWTMEGPMPDPATLDDEGDDDMPLNVVQEKAKLERSSSQQKSSSAQQNPDVFGQIPSPPARPSTTDAPAVRPSPSKVSPPPKQAKPADSLLGLDFFGAPQSAPSGSPSGALSNPSISTSSSRPDLKQSILSLYASAPRPQPQPQHERQSSFGGMQSPSAPAALAQQSSFGGLDDAFSGLSFTSHTSPLPPKPQQQSKPNPFAAFDKPANQRSAVASPQLTSPQLGGGGFFDTSPKTVGKPAVASKPPPQNPLVQKANPVSLDFGSLDFNPPKTAASTKAPTASNPNDLFDFPDPPSTKEPKPTSKPSQASSDLNSAFNLSTPAVPSQVPSKSVPPASAAFAGFSTADPWASNDAWATPEPSAPISKPKAVKPSSIPANSNESAWGASSTSGFGGGGGVQAAPKIAPDEDFGGWNSAAAPAPAPAPVAATKPSSHVGGRPPGSGYGGSEDLFSNVWE